MKCNRERKRQRAGWRGIKRGDLVVSRRAWENDSASGMRRWVRDTLEFATVPQRITQPSAGMSAPQPPLPGPARPCSTAAMG